MSYEKSGYSQGGYPQEPPPQYDGRYGYGQQNYPPQQPTDHPAFPPGGYTQTNVIVAPGPMTMSEPPPPDYMGRAIFVTLCCFWPIGIFAIMKASEARSSYARGDIVTARSNSSSARQLSNIAIMAGVASILIGIIIIGVYIGLIMNNMRY